MSKRKIRNARSKAHLVLPVDRPLPVQLVVDGVQILFLLVGDVDHVFEFGDESSLRLFQFPHDGSLRVPFAPICL